MPGRPTLRSLPRRPQRSGQRQRLRLHQRFDHRKTLLNIVTFEYLNGWNLMD